VVVTGGVGYKVISPTALSPGQSVELEIVSITSRDATTTLYGFTDSAQAEAFTALVKVPKVGPAIAIAILRDIGPTGLAAAVAASDSKALTRAAGVGKAAAEAICSLVKLPDLDTTATSVPAPILDALLALGFPEPAARLAAAEADPAQDESTQLTVAIQSLRGAGK
jgi:Holliday junction DNA helicase RuvA